MPQVFSFVNAPFFAFYMYHSMKIYCEEIIALGEWKDKETWNNFSISLEMKVKLQPVS